MDKRDLMAIVAMAILVLVAIVMRDGDDQD